MKFPVLILFISFFLSVQSQSIEVEEVVYGLYKAEKSRSVESQGSPTGQTLVSRNHGFYAKTDSIPMKMGIQFGVAYRLITPSDDPLQLKVVWKYPKKIKNGNGKKFSTSEHMVLRSTNKVVWEGYKLTDEFEMIPGTWVFEIYHKKKLLYSKEFYLVELDH